MDKLPKTPPQTQEKKEDITNITQEAIVQADGIEVLPENRNEKGELLAPNGEVSNLQNELHWKMVRTPAFKEWFGDWQHDPEHTSKLIDLNGEPIIVYHCSDKQLEGLKFDSNKSRWLTSPGTSGALGKGTYFSPYLKHTRKYGNQTYFCFLNVKKPTKVMSATDTGAGFDYLKLPGLTQFIKILPLSLLRSRERGAVMEIENSKYSTGEKYYEIAVPNEQDIMIAPSPVVKMDTWPTNMPWEPGHNFLNKSSQENSEGEYSGQNEIEPVIPETESTNSQPENEQKIQELTNEIKSSLSSDTGNNKDNNRLEKGKEKFFELSNQLKLELFKEMETKVDFRLEYSEYKLMARGFLSSKNILTAYAAKNRFDEFYNIYLSMIGKENATVTPNLKGSAMHQKITVKEFFNKLDTEIKNLK